MARSSRTDGQNPNLMSRGFRSGLEQSGGQIQPQLNFGFQFDVTLSPNRRTIRSIQAPIRHINIIDILNLPQDFISQFATFIRVRLTDHYTEASWILQNIITERVNILAYPTHDTDGTIGFRHFVFNGRSFTISLSMEFHTMCTVVRQPNALPLTIGPDGLLLRSGENINARQRNQHVLDDDDDDSWFAGLESISQANITSSPAGSD